VTSKKDNEDLANSETLAQATTGSTASPASTPVSELSSSPSAAVPPPKVAGRYVILGLLGRGGMGAVYRALDTELDEVVALKMLRSELGASEVLLERFRREVKLARRVTHPNVARMFDIGEHEGTKFLTMELIDGKTLTELSLAKGRLSLARVLSIAGSVCAGLTAAHEAGVVHRDLKPDNVMVAHDGRVVITDFGIARAPVGSDRATMGGVVGTPAYMAPEQVEARPDIDARADLYAFGVMLFELLTGTLPWVGESPLAIAAARLYKPARDVRELRPDVPPALAEVLARCLARDRDDRPSDAAALATALAQAAPTQTAGSVPLPSAAPVARPSTPPESGLTPVAQPKTVAVLPFRNQGPPEDEFVAEGLTDDLIDALSMTAGLRVRPRGTVERFRGLAVDPRDIGRELGVEVVVEGSVRRAGARVRLTARLTSVDDGFQLWAQRFERPANDLLVVSDETAHAIAEALTVHAAKGRHVAPSDAEAVELYLRARAEASSMTATAVLRGVELLRQAHERAPSDIAILSAYARASARAWFFQGSAPPDTAARARMLAERAARAAPKAPEALLALAMVQLMDQDLPGCAEHCRRALQRAPDHAEALELAGRLLLEAGRPELALERLQRALALDPSLRSAWLESLHAHALLGDFDRVFEMLARDSQYSTAEGDAVVRARMALWSPRVLETLKDVDIPDDALEMSPWSLVRLARDVANGLPVDQALGFMATVPERTKGASRFRTLLCQLLVEFNAYLGRNDDALHWLEESVATGLADLSWLDRSPPLAPLRGMPRFLESRRTVEERARGVLLGLGVS